MKKLIAAILLSIGLVTAQEVRAADSITPTRLMELISAQKGKSPVLVTFFASWCGPCRMEIPHLIELADSKENVTVIGIDIDQDAKDSDAFEKEMGINFPVYHDTGVLAALYNVSAIPHMTVYTKGGKMYRSEPGLLDKARILALIRTAGQMN